MNLKTTIRSKIRIPKLDFTSTLMEVGKKDMVIRLAKNIQQGVDLQGAAYPALAASTIKAKGHSDPLIETGALHGSWQVVKHAKNEVIIRIKAGRRKIAQYLQVDGIKTKTGRRRFNFFGVSTQMEKAGIRRMEKEIKKRVHDAQ